MLYQKLSENPLKSKQDVQKALFDILKPLDKYFETSKFGLKFDSGGTVYDEKVREIEAVLRPLWGIVPLLAGKGTYPLLDQYLNQIKNGTDPDNESYWGEINDKDQRMVEMAVLGVGLALAKEQLWDAFTDEEQQNLYNWLKQINEYEMPQNNWLFFRILVNLGFKQIGKPYNVDQMQQDLECINSYYLENGWYLDGYPNQIDYYVPFAIHFYSLVYVKIMGEEDPVYTPLFKNRAIEFAQTFRSYFDDNGAAIPFGRSMTYRFAQSAFWGALAFADIEALPWGEIRRLCLQNLRHWFKQDIFSAHGELTIGYHYRNLIMAEGYNAFGSPYWALKSFIFLALSDDHPFWTSEEEIGDVPNHLVIPEARSILQKDASGNQVQMFTMGQHCELHAHVESKYEKFVYSSVFGFSISKGMIGLRQGAYDNTLAVSENNEYYRMRYGVEKYRVNDDYLYSLWKPWDNVEIETYIIPLMPWHVRIHVINTGRRLRLAEGGFAINNEGDHRVLQDKEWVTCSRHQEISGILKLLGNQTSELLIPEPNTNLMHSKTAIPTLKSECGPGEYVMASAVLGAVGENIEELWAEAPQIEVKDKCFIVKHQAKNVKIFI